MIAAIILAAGASQRMGCPKALLTLKGETFLQTTIAASFASGIDRCVAVLGPDADKILSHIALVGVTVVRNEAPETGPIGSIRLALASLVNHPVEAAVVWHVDQPHVAVATLTKLVDRFRQGAAAIVLPAFAGKRGHPVLFARSVFDELMMAPETEGARAVVRADPSRVAVVPVDDPAVLEDVDTPEAYAALLRRADASGASS